MSRRKIKALAYSDFDDFDVAHLCDTDMVLMIRFPYLSTWLRQQTWLQSVSVAQHFAEEGLVKFLGIAVSNSKEGQHWNPQSYVTAMLKAKLRQG